MTSRQLPTAEEIAALPLWALVLFAVRCARLAQESSFLRIENARAIDRAISAASAVVAELTRSGKHSGKLRAATREASEACEAAREAVGEAVREAVRKGLEARYKRPVEAAKAAVDAAEAAVDAAEAAEAAAAAAAEADDAVAYADHRIAAQVVAEAAGAIEYVDVAVIREDFSTVAELAKAQALPFEIPPEWFQPTSSARSSASPPASTREGAVSTPGAESAPGASALEVTLAFNHDAPPEEIEATTAELTRLLDRVYRAHGGSGLILDTLQVEAPKLAEVPR